MKGPLPPHVRLTSFLAAEELDALLDWVFANEARFESATVTSGRAGSGVEVDPQSRVALTLRELGPLAAPLRTRLMDALPQVREATGSGGPRPSTVELELAAHGDGAHFAPHTDTAIGAGRRVVGTEGQDRLLSGVYYFYRLPKRFSGGELRLYRFGAKAGAEAQPSDFLDLEPLHNSLVAFPSWAPHEVRQVLCPSGEFQDYRFAVNCWYCGSIA